MRFYSSYATRYLSYAQFHCPQMAEASARLHANHNQWTDGLLNGKSALLSNKEAGVRLQAVITVSWLVCRLPIDCGNGLIDSLIIKWYIELLLVSTLITSISSFETLRSGPKCQGKSCKGHTFFYQKFHGFKLCLVEDPAKVNYIIRPNV